jgi:hypothetical protein
MAPREKEALPSERSRTGAPEQRGGKGASRLACLLSWTFRPGFKNVAGTPAKSAGYFGWVASSSGLPVPPVPPRMLPPRRDRAYFRRARHRGRKIDAAGDTRTTQAVWQW